MIFPHKPLPTDFLFLLNAMVSTGASLSSPVHFHPQQASISAPQESLRAPIPCPALGSSCLTLSERPRICFSHLPALPCLQTSSGPSAYAPVREESEGGIVSAPPPTPSNRGFYPILTVRPLPYSHFKLQQFLHACPSKVSQVILLSIRSYLGAHKIGHEKTISGAGRGGSRL